MSSIRLGVNIDHVATLREVRKSRYPDLIEAAEAARRGGADQITIHLREDRRHIQDSDLWQLMKWGRLPINLEMALTQEMVSIALKARPYSVTLVPERRAEMTTESGLDLRRILKQQSLLRDLGRQTKIYSFIDPDLSQIELTQILNFEGCEFHTGPYSEARPGSAQMREIERLRKAAVYAVDLGLEVKAGHGLHMRNLKPLLRVPFLIELNIGHSIVSRAIFLGLERATREVKDALLKLS